LHYNFKHTLVFACLSGVYQGGGFHNLLEINDDMFIYVLQTVASDVTGVGMMVSWVMTARAGPGATSGLRERKTTETKMT